MATTIRINSDVKERMDRLKARLRLKGIKLTQAELVEFMIKVTENSSLLDDNIVEKELGEDFISKLKKIKFKGSRSSYRDIDEELYGENN